MYLVCELHQGRNYIGLDLRLSVWPSTDICILSVLSCYFFALLERSYSFARSAEKDLLYGLSGKTACMLGLGVRFFVLIFCETTQWVKTWTLLKFSCWKLHVVSKWGSSLCCLISVAAVLWAGSACQPWPWQWAGQVWGGFVSGRLQVLFSISGASFL